MVVLDGEGAECTLNGLYLGDRRRVVDNHTTIDHARPDCGSREIYKGILGDHARAVFNGKIVVGPPLKRPTRNRPTKPFCCPRMRRSIRSRSSRSSPTTSSARMALR